MFRKRDLGYTNKDTLKTSETTSVFRRDSGTTSVKKQIQCCAVEECLALKHNPFVLVGNPFAVNNCTHCLNNVVVGACKCGVKQGYAIGSNLDSDFKRVTVVYLDNTSNVVNATSLLGFYCAECGESG